MRRGLMSVALEERVEEEQVEGMDVAEAVEESPEVDMTEAVEAAGEVATGEDMIEQGIAAADGIDRIAEQAEASLPEGGLTPREAEMARVAVESLMLVIGGGEYKPRTPVPAMESFGETGSRVASTRYAVESFKERATAIWNTIVAAIKRAIAAVKQFFGALFASGQKVADRAEKLQKLAAEKKGQKLTADAKVSIPGILSVGGKLPAPGDFDGYFTKHQSLDVIHSNRATMLKSLADKMEEIVGAADGQPTEAAARFATWAKNEVKAKTTELVFGGKVLEITEGENLAPWSAKLVDGKTSEGGEIGALTPEQAEELAGRVHKYSMANFVSAKEAIAEAEKAADALLKKLADSATTKEGVTKDPRARVVSSVVNSAINLTTKVQVSLNSYDLKVVVALEAYIAASLNKVEKKEAKKEGEKA